MAAQHLHSKENDWLHIVGSMPLQYGLLSLRRTTRAALFCYDCSFNNRK
jgi:hypothetical protein